MLTFLKTSQVCILLAILLKENKFDLAKKSFKIIFNNYLDEFYNFCSNTLDCKSGLIGNGTIELFGKKVIGFLYILGIIFLYKQKS